MKKLVIFMFILVGFLAMPSSAFAFLPNKQCGKEVASCTIAPFSFTTGITPECFRDPRHIATAIGWCDLIQIVSNIIGLLYAIVFPIVILMVAFGGLTLLTSGGDEARLKQGKGFITSALIGAVIALSAGLLISFIVNGLGVIEGITLFPWLF